MVRGTVRVHVGGGRRERHLDPFGAQHRQVVVEGTRIGVEVLAGTELQRIDEDRHHDHRTLYPLGRPDQGQMTVVQGAHRRHQHDPSPGVPQRAGHVGDIARAGVDVEFTGGELRRLTHRHDCPASASTANTSSGACARWAVRSELARYACASSGSTSVERPQMTGDRGGVTAGDRTGQRRLAALQRVLQRRPGQRADHPLGDAARLVADQFLAEQFLPPQRGAQRLDGVEQHRDDVVAGMRQRGVIQRAGVLTDPEGLAADLEHQRLGDRVSHLVGRGDAEAGVGQPDDVLVGPGERHRGVDRQRNAALFGQRGEHGDAVGARGVHDDGARPHGAGGRQAGDQ